VDQREDAAVGHAVIPGLRYVPGFLSPDEHRVLLETLEAIRFDQWQQIRLRGQLARRRKLAFGYNYEPSDRAVSPAPPIPDYLLPLRKRCAVELGVAAESLDQATMQFYPPGAGIGRHKDAPFFGDKVIGVSLGSEARMIFRHGKEKVPMTLEPGSLLVLSGPARSVWTHEMPPVGEARYSIYFRSLK
jgi:alkylated DNA repair dioxygenase AlkB